MTQTVPLWQALVTVFGVIVVALIGHWITIRKHRAELGQKNYENSMRIVETHDAAYRAYVAALSRYINAESPTYDDFLGMMTAGDIYFHQSSLICNSMLSGMVDPNIRDKTWIPKIKVVVEKTLPNHYDMLTREAAKRGYPYTGELRRSDHESIYAAAEMFSASDAWTRPHET